ncbi:hypothetical protein HJG60_010186 [Phyllostomus discolor]|uniref:Uncharacterized protein n=1 Tax=Phyllostomus discolor TaxID=89673 RepID=A0A834B1C1_9CHIR|nr:hypothetical protein HJG60_010186 [Phyllostomus discolor]
MQGLTVSPGDRTHSQTPGSEILCTVPVAFKILAPWFSLSAPCSVPWPPSHPIAPFPSLCRWEYPVAFRSPGSLSCFQREESGNSGVRRSRLLYSCGCLVASIVTRELPQFSLGVPTQARMLY